MKLLIDAQLPLAIADFFIDCDVFHTSSLKEGNFTTDAVINNISVAEQRVLITKDVDFYYSYIATGKPYKLILLKLGNMRLFELKDYFKKNADKVIELMHTHSFIVLNKDHIKILE
jgi:predicted nuclease of predicted toxin-antitoxin system